MLQNIKQRRLIMIKALKRGLVITMSMIIVFAMNVFAFDKGTGRVTVPTDCKYVTAKKNVSRSCKYSYAIVKADSVYPVENGKEDTYTRCKTRLYCGKTPISSEVILKENNLTHINIYNGQLNRTSFNIKFAGNNPGLSARISYYYNGK